jgi:predicted HAD superfamily Cof-like phosphohydrolase
MVEEFHRKFGVPVAFKGTIIPPDRGLLRARLIVEEAAESVAALQTRDYVNLAKELADLLYVVYGTAVEAGIPLDVVFAEVHRSNMTKTPAKDAGGKVQKGPDYEPADVEGVLSYV